MDYQRPSTRQDFEVAIICASPLEFNAISLLFDQFWDEDGDPYGRATGDPNYYTTGRFGKYDVVLALLTRTDRATAASAAASIRTSYSGLRLALFVGICSGVPQIHDGDDEDEIMLGDVVISSTVVQCDFDTQHPKKYIHKDTVEDNSVKPNKDIRNLLVTFQTELGLGRLQKQTVNFLKQLQANATPKKRRKYKYPGIIEDKLFESTYRHKHRGSPACVCNDHRWMSDLVCKNAIHCPCKDLGCDEKYLVVRQQLTTKERLPRDGTEEAHEPSIHVGAIASGDITITSGEYRDQIAENEGIIAFEMGGAGIWEEVPCIIIKGICDYADCHQSKNWQNYAAATAASASKAVLQRYIQTEKPSSALLQSGKQ
ncbi:uncharacterized protein TRIVIDRAFT_49960 [Trichoderma virens Gv29-8]|uniref:Nucleoside phosphorylase domain-containing protein n=1 Tax=Hypocrea virens (strain Gv29-8 / FGSC 10586) TaxID=413071 RepID=G9MXR5_HYPVG|nr:uncharacterized protein TRIVIDRAFT_49960 [Trichoderma virens Gv29-8]EHK20676.1 hypothetical protein TRIVIDRAFT_49960 [Trichoderma virens Gv29-8]